MEEKLKAILYCRVSQEAKKMNDKQLTSFEQQKLYQNDAFDIVKTFDDRASGTTLKKRIGFQEMFKYVGINIKFLDDDYIFQIFKETDIKIIACANTSRFSRDIIDAKRSIDVLHKQGIKVYFSQLDAYSDDSNIDLLLNIFFSIDNQYSNDLGNKVKAGMKRKKENNQVIYTSGKIFGFDLIDGKLFKNGDSEKVKEMFELYSTGDTSIRKLSLKFEKNPSTIRGILKNKKYAGFEYVDSKEVHPNIEPIITLELFNKVQNIIEKRVYTDEGGKTKGFKTQTYPLSSKLVCPICGTNLCYKKDKRSNMWQCAINSKKTNKDCTHPGISEKRLYSYFSEMIESNSWREFIKFKLNNQLQNIHLIDISNLKNCINGIDIKIDKLLDLYLSEELPKDKYLERKEVLELDKNNLLEQLKNAEDIQAYKESLEALESEYMDKLDHIESLIKNKDYDSVGKLVKKIYFAYNPVLTKKQTILDFPIAKKRLCVSKVVWDDFDILDNFEI